MRRTTRAAAAQATGLLALLVTLAACGSDAGTGGSSKSTGTNTGSGGGGQGGDGGSNSTAALMPNGSSSSSSSGTNAGGAGGENPVGECINDASECAGFCGFVPKCDGGVVECAGCTGENEVCGLKEPNKCDVPVVTCTPKLPAEVCPGKCGPVTDGCDGAIECDGSNGGLACGANQACLGDKCEDKVVCTPKTCAELGFECGPAGDTCGNTLDCSAEVGCTNGQVCGTGSDAQKCVDSTCIPLTAAEACAATCGITGDGCGNTLDCEADPVTKCPDGQTCGGGGVTGECGTGQTCVPFTAAQICAGKCGAFSDGCSGFVTCDSTNGGETCDANAGESCGGGGIAGECGGVACTPKTQAQACPGSGGFASCGQVPDGCNGLVQCGTCPTGQQCGLDPAKPGICAEEPKCVPTAVATACAGKCGVVPDGCGGSHTCTGQNGGVTCVDPEFCGAKAPNACGKPDVTCVPKTCADFGHTCGYASDGCGKQLDCWTTQSKQCPDPTSQACIANATTGAQSCVSGGATCAGPLCNSVPTCSTSSPTTLTGTVTTPGRGNPVVNRIPVPNAIVYIPADPSVALPAIFEGVDPNNALSCGRCDDEKLVADGQQVLAAAVTDYRGRFVLKGKIPVGVKFNLVTKIGKFRRVVEIPATTAKACASAALTTDDARLPKNPADGIAGTWLPKIAISTGSVDEMECVLRNIGIDEGEFTIPSGTGRIHMYRANGARRCGGTYTSNGQTIDCRANNNSGCVNNRSGCSTSPTDQNLYDTNAAMRKYDMVIADCQGTEHATGDNARILNYVNNGGRLFASHWAYSFLNNNGTLDAASAWGTNTAADNDTGYISMPTGTTQRAGANDVKSPLFRDWLDFQGALVNTTAGDPLENPNQPRFDITDPRDLAGATVGASTDEWIYRQLDHDDNNNTPEVPRVQQLSFNTPYGAAEAAICGRVAYSGFHVAAAANSGSSSYFPQVCSNGALTTQELTLVFQLFDLGNCVSDGDPVTPPTCVPKTAADVCPQADSACGFLNDGCGGVVDCGGCSGDFYCDGTTCRPKTCVPATCDQLGYNCGEHPDGCGGVARDAAGNPGCGTCTNNQQCGLGGPGLCGGTTCTPIATNIACSGLECGQVSDGCGGVISCGQCVNGQVCGGGAGPNQCGNSTCTKVALENACAGKTCGFASDGCGGTYDCGTCVAPESCGGGGTPNVCGQVACTPQTKANACLGLECGFVSDGCGGAIKCGDCANGAQCGGGGPNKCGAPCTPTTCQAKGAECGAISDECNGILVCPPCGPNEVCGAAGPNQCGPGAACTPTTCAAQNAECGLVGNGCGDVVDCGDCTTAGETCGGAGVANQCGKGTGGCTPTTCEAQNVKCGAASNGCGGLLNCGGCGTGFSCEAGQCKEIPK